MHRIFRASERGDVKAVRKLQKTLIRSWSARALAVRKVTQDNQGHFSYQLSVISYQYLQLFAPHSVGKQECLTQGTDSLFTGVD